MRTLGIVDYGSLFVNRGRYANAGAGLGRWGTSFGGSGQGLASSYAGGSALYTSTPAAPFGDLLWYAGIGPKNYHRSDQRIEDDINRRLYDDPAIDACDIRVKVLNAEVTLEGFVEDRKSKRLAEDLALAVPGVRDVHNRLRVLIAHSWIVRSSPPRP